MSAGTEEDHTDAPYNDGQASGPLICPDWCQLAPERHGVEITTDDEGVVDHSGPSFGRFFGGGTTHVDRLFGVPASREAGMAALEVHVTLDDNGSEFTNPRQLRAHAHDALAAAEWLEENGPTHENITVATVERAAVAVGVEVGDLLLAIMKAREVEQ